jgi:ABC-type transport system substrate-binding protein
MLYTVYQPLVFVNASANFNQGVVQYMPGLAANWTVSPDGTTYTFNLRQDIVFSTGHPFNAYSAWLEEYGFYYLSANSSYWWENYNFFDMSSVTFGPSTIALFNNGGVVNPSPAALKIMSNSSWPIYVNGPHQIVFRLRAPFIWFPGTLLTFCGLMFDSQWVLDNGGFGTPASINPYFNQHPIPGSGPYVITQVSEQSYVKFTQDPNYWANRLNSSPPSGQPYLDPGHVKNVIVYYKQDDVARYTDLSTGATQLSDIQQSDWSLVANNPQYAYVKSPAWSALIYVMSLNTQLYPTNITAVRQAIVHAINFTDLAQKAFLGQVTPFVGPEYPAWKDFYNLGGSSPYSYNVTLSQQLLASAHISNMPTFTLRTLSACESCTNEAQVIQADLAQIGITVNIDVLLSSQYFSVYGNYATNLANAAQLGQISFVNGGSAWGPYGLTPADNWVSFMSNTSVWGNWAVYNNPIVQNCVNLYTNSADVSAIQSACRAAQTQANNDAPYYWMGVSNLWIPSGGSTVWNKNVIKGFLLDPTFGGQSSLAIFNTVTFV